MKHIFFFFISTIFLTNLSAQHTSGRIVYQEVINTKPDMQKAEEEGWAQWADRIPESMTFKKQLTFNEKSSMYINLKIEMEDNDDSMMRRMMQRNSNSNK